MGPASHAFDPQPQGHLDLTIRTFHHYMAIGLISPPLSTPLWYQLLSNAILTQKWQYKCTDCEKVKLRKVIDNERKIWRFKDIDLDTLIIKYFYFALKDRFRKILVCERRCTQCSIEKGNICIVVALLHLLRDWVALNWCYLASQMYWEINTGTRLHCQMFTGQHIV